MAILLTTRATVRERAGPGLRLAYGRTRRQFRRKGEDSHARTTRVRESAGRTGSARWRSHFIRPARREFHNRLRWERGLAFVSVEPGRFALLTLRMLVDLWRPIPDAVEEGGAHGGRWRDYVAAATYLPMLLLAVIADGPLYRRADPDALLEKDRGRDRGLARGRAVAANASVYSE